MKAGFIKVDLCVWNNCQKRNQIFLSNIRNNQQLSVYLINALKKAKGMCLEYSTFKKWDLNNRSIRKKRLQEFEIWCFWKLLSLLVKWKWRHSVNTKKKLSLWKNSTKGRDRLVENILKHTALVNMVKERTVEEDKVWSTWNILLLAWSVETMQRRRG